MYRILIGLAAMLLAIGCGGTAKAQQSGTVSIAFSGGSNSDTRPCEFFQLTGSQTWYAIPMSNMLFPQQTSKIILSAASQGGLPIAFNVGNPVSVCSNYAEAFDIQLFW